MYVASGFWDVGWITYHYYLALINSISWQEIYITVVISNFSIIWQEYKNLILQYLHTEEEVLDFNQTNWEQNICFISNKPLKSKAFELYSSRKLIHFLYKNNHLYIILVYYRHWNNMSRQKPIYTLSNHP